MTYAATGQAGNLRINVIQAEIMDLWLTSHVLPDCRCPPIAIRRGGGGVLNNAEEDQLLKKKRTGLMDEEGDCMTECWPLRETTDIPPHLQQTPKGLGGVRGYT